MKNAKHLQGICNNLIVSLTRYPENMFTFWKHLTDLNSTLDFSFDLISDEEMPSVFSIPTQADLQSTILRYRKFLFDHLDMYDIDKNEIDKAKITIKTEKKIGDMHIIEAKFTLTIKEGKKYEAKTVPTLWGNETDNIETFSNGVRKREARPY